MQPYSDIDNARDRAEALMGPETDLHNYLSDVYTQFTTTATQATFRAIHRGLMLQTLQATLTASEQLSALIPESLAPWRRLIWVPVDVEEGEYAFDDPPWRILGLKRTVSLEEDWLLPDTAWIYDYQRGVLVVDNSVEDGRYFIPEMLYENPYIWNTTAAPLDLTREMVPDGYTPEHLPHLLTAYEYGLQHGFTQRVSDDVLAALAGNPFAYAAGRISEIVRGTLTIPGHNHLTLPGYVAIETAGPDGTYQRGRTLYCELPATCVDVNLKAVGTKVRRFETLLDEPHGEPTISVTFKEGFKDATWGRPFRTNRIDDRRLGVGLSSYNWEDLTAAVGGYWNNPQFYWGSVRVFIDLGLIEDIPPALRTWDDLDDVRWGDLWVWLDERALASLGTGRPLLLRNLTQDWTVSLVIRRLEQDRLVVDQPIPQVNDDDILYAQILATDPEVELEAELHISTPYLNAKDALLKLFMEEALPQHIRYEVDWVSYRWENLWCNWEDYNFTWDRGPQRTRLLWGEMGDDVFWGYMGQDWGEF